MTVGPVTVMYIVNQMGTFLYPSVGKKDTRGTYCKIMWKYLLGRPTYYDVMINISEYSSTDRILGHGHRQIIGM